MSRESLIDFSEHTYEPTEPIFADWHAANGIIRVTIIAYTLGATMAFCVIGLGEKQLLTTGNYGICWLPTRDLTILSHGEV